MPMTRSTDLGISEYTQVWFARETLKWAAPAITLDKFGAVKPMPKNKGDTVQFRRPITFDALTAPLLEGVTPTPKQFRYEHIRATLKQYGMLVQITDIIEDLAEPPVLKDAAVQVGENVGRTNEAITWGVLRAGTNVFYSNGTQRSDVNTPVTLAKLRAVTRSLDQQKAMHVTQVVEPGPDVGTRSVEAGWIAVCHTHLKSDIRNLAGFLPVSDYGHRRTVHEREFGTVEEIRFVTSPDLDAFEDAGGTAGSMVSTSGTSADVFPIIIFGKEAYGVVPLRGENSGMDPIIIPPGRIDKSDPLGQRGFVGAKWYYTAIRLNEAWMARLETAATAL